MESTPLQTSLMSLLWAGIFVEFGVLLLPYVFVLAIILFVFAGVVGLAALILLANHLTGRLLDRLYPHKVHNQD